MSRLIVTRRFRSDIDSILRYLEDVAGPRSADNYARRFRVTIDRLVQFPQSGAPRPMLGAGARAAVIPPYILIYDYDPGDENLVLLRVLHERREITRELVRRRR
jgi:toxin ParE1/3/4